MKHSLLLSLLMFVCLGVFGQSTSLPPQKVTLDALQSSIDSQQSTITTLQDSIQSLQADNADLHKQLDNLEKELDRYHEDIKTKTATTETHISWWLVLVSIILTIVITVVVGGLGVLSPLIISRRSEKNAMIAQVQVKHSKQQVSKANDAVNAAKASAAQAQTDADAAKNIVNEAKIAVEAAKTSAAQAQADANAAKADADKVSQVETTMNNLAKDMTKTAANAQSGFKKAKAIQYYVQALQESDENRAIELYTRCIEEDNEFAEAYNNRGFLRHKIGGPDVTKQALDDYATAIELFEKQGRGIYAEAYTNRGIVHFENQELDKAKNDFDAAISKDYAEAYLNRGLLYYYKRISQEAKKDFDNAIKKKSNFAEAYYIRGLFIYCHYEKDYAIKEIVNAKTIKNDVVETLSNRTLLTGKIKELDNSINGVEYSKDMKILIRVPKDKKNPFIILSSVTEIGIDCFSGCKNLTSIEIPEGVTDIDFRSLQDCSNLTTIVIPESVTYIDTYLYSTINYDGELEVKAGPLSGCPKLKEFVVNENNPDYRSKDGVLYTKDMSHLIAVPGYKTSIEIPESVTHIDGGIANCYRLNKIRVSDNNVNYSIKDGVLYSKNLEILIAVPKHKDSIVIPTSVTKIEPYAFSDCKYLTYIEIPPKVTNIKDCAFFGCTSLTSIEIPESVTKIGDYAFYGCPNLVKLHLRHKIPIDPRLSLLELDFSKITLYVPKGSGEAYRNSGFYNGFKDIIEE